MHPPPGPTALLFAYAFLSNIALAVVPHEPAIIWYGPRLGVWTTTLVGTAGTVFAAVADHRLFAPLIGRLAQRRLESSPLSATRRGGQGVRTCPERLFRRLPLAPAGLVAARRELMFLVAEPERRLLRAIATRLPQWVTSDGLTALGVVGALGAGAAYALSTLSVAWLWAASAMLVVQWFGDSLDGTLARVRRAERPRYGYYLDHIVDAFSTAAIGAGIGLSPYVNLGVALAGVLAYLILSINVSLSSYACGLVRLGFAGIGLSPYVKLGVALAGVLAYLILSINIYLESQAFGVFRLGYSRIGPTEARIVLVAANVALALSGPGAAVVPVATGAAAALAVGMFVMVAVRVGRNLSALGRLEPPPPPATAFVSRRPTGAPRAHSSRSAATPSSCVAATAHWPSLHARRGRDWTSAPAPVCAARDAGQPASLAGSWGAHSWDSERVRL